MRVLFATAELTPIATVGGLAAAASGLVHELRRQGVEVDVVLPDYGGIALAGEEVVDLPVPDWAGPARVRVGEHPVAGRLHLVDVPGMARPHPYLDGTGQGWLDNDRRFLSFSVAVASLWREHPGDVLHLNDWHTAAALAAFDPAPPSVVSIHNLAYQGWSDGWWLQHLGPRAGAYEWYGGTNPLKGGLLLADAVVAVSPTYAREIVEPANGFGLHELLRWRGPALVGIRNGIDTSVWDPATDPHLPTPFDVKKPAGKTQARAALAARVGFDDTAEPIAMMVTRLTHQKGTDLVGSLARYLRGAGLRLAVLGSGEADHAAALRAAAEEQPQRVAFVEGYDDALSHLLHGGADLLLMPSRFEPCGLSQMQAMRYGTLPVVTDVGGLHDTVTDADARPDDATGWVAASTDLADLVDVLHRASRGFADSKRRKAMQKRGMSADWSWADPARQHVRLYERVMAGRGIVPSAAAQPTDLVPGDPR